MTYTEKEFNEHLERDHRLTVLSEYLQEMVYGGTDGIVTTFAVIAGFSGAYLAAESTLQLSVMSVLLFGLANLFADGTAMGLGNFLSLRAEKKRIDSHRQMEKHEIETNPAEEEQETIYMLKRKGFTEADAKTMTALYKKYPNYWLDFMMHEELNMQEMDDINPALNGLMTFVAFCIFGFLPIIPYLVTTDPQSAFTASCLAALGALTLLGFLSGTVSKQNRLMSILETVIVGCVAGGVAYFVGTLFA